MTTVGEAWLRDFLVREMRAFQRELAAAWLVGIREVVGISARSVFPGSTLLDHIPSLIVELCDHLAVAASGPIGASDPTKSAATRLGDLRFEQRASIHQVLCEFDALADVVAEFMASRLEATRSAATPADAVRVVARVRGAIRGLQLLTVDRFVARFAQLAETQTSQLRDFNLLVSHELRQPLSVLTVTTQLLLERYPDPELQTLKRNVNRLVHVVDELESLAGVRDTEGDEAAIGEVSLERVVQESVQQQQGLAQERRVTIDVEGPLPTVTAESARVELVFTNLLSNAIKYADEAKADRWVKIRPGTGDADFVSVYVEDNGVGIPASQLDKVFERFVRASGPTSLSDRETGLGFGLALVRESMLLMGGHVHLAPRDGGGLTVTLSWPRPGQASREEPAVGS